MPNLYINGKRIKDVYNADNIHFKKIKNADGVVIWNRSGLPNIYQEVEYIQADGNQYLDSEYAFINPELKIEFKYMKTVTTGSNPFGVDRPEDGGRRMHGHIFSNNLYTGDGGRTINIPDESQKVGKIFEGSVQIIGTTTSDQIAILTLNGKSQTFLNSSSGFLFEGTQFSDYILATRSSSASYLMSGRMYYLRFYDNTGALVRNFVSCRRKSDNVVGMYDTVMRKFHTNLGTGAIVAGPDV
ncbi:MAG: hypothetical protein KBS62_03475 [Oscillospiraceae bacterium]|nr:hypothetical protein [Candidatus Ruminococcus equi]